MSAARAISCEHCWEPRLGIGPPLADGTAMRLARLALVASLALTSGCVALAAVGPPLAGVAVGVGIAVSRRDTNPDVSVTIHGVAGGMIGVLVDALVIVFAVNDEQVIEGRTR
jgi:hypothetical protein